MIDWPSRDVLCEWYWNEGMTLDEIAKRLNCSYSTVHRHFEKVDIQKRKHGSWPTGREAAINDHVFDEWTQQNSWALGLLMADGSFPKTHPTMFRVTNTNFELLRAYRSVFQSDKRIYKAPKDEGHFGDKPVGVLGLASRKIIRFLKSINAYGTKDERNPFFHVPADYKWAFIKGMFDGDGNGYEGIFSISGRSQMIAPVYWWICANLERKPNRIYQSTSSNKTHYFQIAPNDAVDLKRHFETYASDTYESDKFTRWARKLKAA